MIEFCYVTYVRLLSNRSNTPCMCGLEPVVFLLHTKNNHFVQQFVMAESYFKVNKQVEHLEHCTVALLVKACSTPSFCCQVCLLSKAAILIFTHNTITMCVLKVQVQLFILKSHAYLCHAGHCTVCSSIYRNRAECCPRHLPRNHYVYSVHSVHQNGPTGNVK